MPIPAAIYLSILGFLILANVFYYFMFKGGMKPLVIVYELLSGSFMVFMAAAYWIPWLQGWLGAPSALAFGIVVGFDLHFSIWGKPEDIGLPQGELSESEIELAKALSLAFAAPAYVMGLLLSVQLLSS